MKHYLSFILVCLFFAGGDLLIAQTYNMGNQVVNTCGGTIYDTGGGTGVYSNVTRVDSMTIYPSVPGSNAVRLTFTLFAIGALDGLDVLEIFDGPTSSSPRIRQAYTLIGAIGTGESFKSSHPTGAITLKFSTTYNVSYALAGSKSAGFAATVSCEPKNISMNTTGNTSDTICNANFYDSGNRLGVHSGSSNAIKTFYPSTTSEGIKIDLASLNLSSDAYLSIYDGIDINAPLLAKYGTNLVNTNLSNISHTASTSNTSGAITVHFQSSGNLTLQDGWEGSISCAAKTPLQHIAMSNDTLTVCNAKIYDSGGLNADYGNNEDLILTLNPGTPNTAVQLLFTYFNLDYNLLDLLSSADKLIIYDGPSISDARAITLQGNNLLNTPIVSTHPSGALTLHFISDGVERDQGFEITTSCVTKEYRMPRNGTENLTTCEGKIYDSGGRYLDHSQNENGTFIIRPATSNTNEGVRLEFTEFSLGNNDYLYIYDGDNVNAPLLGKFHTNNSPQIIKATNKNSTGALTLHFTSDDPVGNSSSSGWAANISCDIKTTPYYALNNDTLIVCDARLYDSGGPNGNYSNNEDIVMTLYPDSTNKALKLEFSFLNLAIIDIPLDNLTIYDGPNTSSPIATVLNGYSSTAIITSTHATGALTLKFNSNIANNESGWDASLSCVAKNYRIPASSYNSITTCEGYLFDNGGEFNDYSSNADGYTIIHPATAGQATQLEFSEINLNWGDDLYIYDGDSPTAPLLARYAGNLSNSITLPVIHRASAANASKALTVRLKSDVSTTSGFKASITCVAPNPVPTYGLHNGSITVCEASIFDSGGANGDYSNNENIELTIFPSDPNKSVKLSFSDFNFDYNVLDLLTNSDRLIVYDGPNTSSPIANTLYGNSLPNAITSTHATGALTLKFISNLADTDRGFALTTSCEIRDYRMPATGQSSITVCEGNLFDSGGKYEDYISNENGLLTIYPATTGQVIELNFSSFNLESVRGVDGKPLDMLSIYDGIDENAPLIGRYYGNDNPGIVIASSMNTSGALTLKFASNNIVQLDGWEASISCKTATTTPHYSMNTDTIYMCGGKLFDAAGPNKDYFNNEDQSLTICPTTPYSRVSLDFVAFELVNLNTTNADDILYIYDGMSAMAPLLGRHSTGIVGLNVNPPTVPITASLGNTSGCLTLRFISDIALNADGFEANVTCLPGCTPIAAPIITSSITPNSNNIHQLCPNQPISFTVSNVDPNVTYNWSFGDGTTATGTSVTHTYTTSNLFMVSLHAENSLGCLSSSIQRRVLSVPKPTFTTSAVPDSSCVGATVVLTGNAIANNTIVSKCSGVGSDSFLLDTISTGQYTNINCYAPGSTITNASDLELCIKLDHQHLGDLDIELTCPSGKSIKIVKPSSENKVLGIPGGLLGGIGYNYCFNANQTVLLRDGLDITGFPGVGIVAGNYKSEEGFEELVGCPVNGDWKLTVRDVNFNLLIGHFRGWNLDFTSGGFVSDSATFASIVPSINSMTWAPATGLTTTSNTTAEAVVQNMGANNYIFTATDNFGCTHNSDTVKVIGTSGPTVTVSGPLEVCHGSAVTITATTSSPNVTYLWNTGATTSSISPIATGLTTVVYTVTVTSASHTCKTIKNHTIHINAAPIIGITAVPPTVACVGQATTLTATISNATNVIWSTNGTGTFSSTNGLNVTYTPTEADTLISSIWLRATSVGHNAACLAGSNEQVLIVHNPSTAPTATAPTSILCPNTDLQLTVQGGVNGTNAVIKWYSDSLGMNSIGTGSSITVAPDFTSTYYVRRENLCNHTNLVPVTVPVREYIYGPHEATTEHFCIDKDNWRHYYLPEDGSQYAGKIILSVKGDFTLQDPGFPKAKIHYKSDSVTTLSASHQNPLLVPDCYAIDSITREYTFELSRSWEVQTSGSLVNTYNVRFYYDAPDKDSLIALAQNFRNNYMDCDYHPVIQGNSDPSTGFYWYKTDNDTMSYIVPTYGKFCAGINLAGGGYVGNQINYAEFDGITKFSIGSGGITLAALNPLPIKLISFTGERNNKVNNLYWSTATETENSHFNIQRSPDGRNFTTIGTVLGNGSSLVQNDYKFIDIEPLFGINYYRLEDVSFDGHSTFSNVIALDNNGIVKENSKFFPNPTQNSVTYEFTSLESDKISIEVLNMLGQRVITKQYSVAPGINQIFIDLSEYPSGTFLINTKHENSKEKHTERIIKMN